MHSVTPDETAILAAAMFLAGFHLAAATLGETDMNMDVSAASDGAKRMAPGRGNAEPFIDAVGHLRQRSLPRDERNSVVYPRRHRSHLPHRAVRGRCRRCQLDLHGPCRPSSFAARPSARAAAAALIAPPSTPRYSDSGAGNCSGYDLSHA